MKFSNILKALTRPDVTERPLSRLYGYNRSGDNKATMVESEARVIAMVINTLAKHTDSSIEEILDAIIQKFSKENIRNRSGKRWTYQTLIGLVRPIYAGISVSPRGVWRKSQLYPAIVSVDTIKAAMKRLKAAKLV